MPTAYSLWQFDETAWRRRAGKIWLLDQQTTTVTGLAVGVDAATVGHAGQRLFNGRVQKLVTCRRPSMWAIRPKPQLPNSSGRYKPALIGTPTRKIPNISKTYQARRSSASFAQAKGEGIVPQTWLQFFVAQKRNQMSLFRKNMPPKPCYDLSMAGHLAILPRCGKALGKACRPAVWQAWPSPPPAPLREWQSCHRSPRTAPAPDGTCGSSGTDRPAARQSFCGRLRAGAKDLQGEVRSG